MAAPDFQPDLSASPEPTRGHEIFASLLAWMLPWYLSQPMCVSPHRLPQWKGSWGSLGWNWPSSSSIFKLMRGLTPNHVLDLDLDALWGLWVECFCLIAAQTAVNNHRVLGSPFCPHHVGFLESPVLSMKQTLEMASLPAGYLWRASEHLARLGERKVTWWLALQKFPLSCLFIKQMFLERPFNYNLYITYTYIFLEFHSDFSA